MSAVFLRLGHCVQLQPVGQCDGESAGMLWLQSVLHQYHLSTVIGRGAASGGLLSCCVRCDALGDWLYCADHDGTGTVYLEIGGTVRYDSILTGCGCSNSNHHITKTNDNRILHNQQPEGFMRTRSP